MDFETREPGKSKRTPFKKKFKTKEEIEAARAARLARINTSPGTVTALEPQVKRANRFSLYIDDHFAMGLSLNVAATVKRGQEMSRTDLEALLAAEQLEEARNKALSFLAVRPRSEREIRQRLASKKYPEEIINQVIARLGDVKLVDDRDFAKFWVETREGFRPRSKRALQYELRQKGVGAEDITRAIRKVDDSESAYRAAHTKALRFKDLDIKEFREKLTGFLARRGFDYTVTRNAVNRLWQEVNGTSENLDENLESE